jgi:hypothetical protein
MTRRLPIAALLLLAIFPPGAMAQSPAPPPPNLAQLAQWLTGEFDNFQQFFEAKDTKAPMPHERIHTVIAPVAVPVVGAHVLLARESALNEPERVANLHAYSLVAGAPGTIELRLYAFDNQAALLAALRDPAAPTDLPLDRLKPMPGCEVTWRRDAEAFTGTMKPGACQVTWPSTGARVTMENTYRVTADEFWFSERATDAAGKPVFGRADGVPYKLKRARQFSCYAALRKEGTTDQYDSMLDITMHDQGKMVTFKDGGGTPTKYSFELSQLRYSQQTPVMKLALYEAGKEQAFAYTWTEPEGKKIGINLRWIQVGCKIK